MRSIYRDGEWVLFYSDTIDVDDNITEAWDLFTIIVNIPDDVQYVLVKIDAWDADWPEEDDHYDINGEDPSLYALEIVFDILSGQVTVEGNGLDDGEEPTADLTDAFARVTLSIVE